MTLLVCAVGYLAGALPFGVWVTRWGRGLDVREHGSGNIGATNVARVAGKGLGALVLLLDALKGALPVALAMHCWPTRLWLHAAVGLAAFLGHVFSCWLRFRGGKGVATALGVLGMLSPVAAAAGLLVFVLCVARWRVSSLGSLLGALTAAVAMVVLRRPLPYQSLAVLLWLLMLWTHRGNLRRLFRREERPV